jgi:hypothetical protein
MNMRVLFLAALAFSMVAYSQTLPVVPGVAAEADGVYQLRYFANLTAGDSFIDITNAGTNSGFDPDGRVCANLYVFDPAEELVACCACNITPNGLASFSLRNDLIFNTLTGSPLLKGVTVKVLASLPLPVGGGGVPTFTSICNPSTPNNANLVRGLKVWGITLHNDTTLPALAQPFLLTETEFAKAELSATELAKLTGFCRFIQIVASNFGICRNCPNPGNNGGQGADIK